MIRRLKFADLKPRYASRVILLGPGDRTLLLEYEHAGLTNDALANQGSYLLVPGGGRIGNETFLECAERELREETGIIVALDPTVIAEREAPLLKSSGEVVCAVERYFVARVDRLVDIGNDEWTTAEQRTIKRHHWLTLSEVESRDGYNLWPSNLPAIIRAALGKEKIPVIYRSREERIGDLIFQMVD